MKTKRILNIAVIIVIFIIDAIFPLFNVILATEAPTNDLKETDLIRIYNTKTGFDFTVTNDTTIDEVIVKYGEPKITTKSVFGGHAYTFYTDDDYSNYLYLETVKDDAYIISYGTVWNEYYIYDSGYDYAPKYNDNSILRGFDIDNGLGKIKGGIYYNRNRYIDGSNIKMINLFLETYQSDPVFYQKCISEHAVTMYNAICKINGFECNLEFNANIYYINEQFKQNGTRIYNYAIDTGRSPYMHTIGGENRSLNYNNAYFINPGIYAGLFYKYVTNKIDMPEAYKYCICDYSIENERTSMYVVKENIFEIWDEIPLTDEQQTKYDNAKSYYNTAINLLNSETEPIYKSNPIEDVPQNLYAGELKETIKDAAIAYYNSIRAGAGLLPGTKSTGAFKQAQAMAVLQSYRTNVLGLTITHLPPKPDNVSTQFYQTATGYNDLSRGENIAWKNNYDAEKDGIIAYTNQFMDDSSETPFRAGHRTAILNPTNGPLGYGFAKAISTMEFEHGNQNDFEMVAWPSNGVTLMENIKSPNFCWSAKFYKNYTVTQNTTVTVTCLQTSETWHWDTVSKSDNHYFVRDYETSEEEYRNRVLFKDETLTIMPDCVYEVTIENLTNTNTNNEENYTYRCVCKYADKSKYGSELDSIKIDTKELLKVDGTTNTYYVPAPGNIDLDAIIDENVINKKVTWECQGRGACLISQCGEVKILKGFAGTVKVTLKHDISGKTDTIRLQPYDPNQITLSENEMDININDTKELSIYNISSEMGYISDIEWLVIKDSNPNKEYRFDDSEIQKFMEITKINDYRISIKAINASQYENKFKIVIKAKGNSGYYTGETEVNLHIPLQSFQISFGNIKKTGLSILNGAGSAEASTTINMEDFYSKNNSYIVKLIVKYTPTNTTIDKTVNWEIISGNGIITKTEEEAAFLMNRPGEAKIKVTSVEQPEISKVIKITVTSDNPDWPVYTLGDVNEDGKINQKDAKLVLQAYVGKKTLTENQILAADVNFDKKVNQKDAKLILKYYVGKITSF